VRYKKKCEVCGKRLAVDKFRKTLMCRECLCPDFTSASIAESFFITTVGTTTRFDGESLQPADVDGASLLSKALIKSWIKNDFIAMEANNFVLNPQKT